MLHLILINHGIFISVTNNFMNLFNSLIHNNRQEMRSLCQLYNNKLKLYSFQEMVQCCTGNSILIFLKNNIHIFKEYETTLQCLQQRTLIWKYFSASTKAHKSGHIYIRRSLFLFFKGLYIVAQQKNCNLCVRRVKLLQESVPISIPYIPYQPSTYNTQ